MRGSAWLVRFRESPRCTRKEQAVAWITAAVRLSAITAKNLFRWQGFHVDAHGSILAHDRDFTEA
jgi:hypothetical protein